MLIIIIDNMMHPESTRCNHHLREFSFFIKETDLPGLLMYCKESPPPPHYFLLICISTRMFNHQFR